MYVLFILLEMREFLLIEFSERTAFEQVFLCIVKLSAEPLPKEGGMLDEKRTITLPNRALMHEVSYRGDLVEPFRVFAKLRAFFGLTSNVGV